MQEDSVWLLCIFTPAPPPHPPPCLPGPEGVMYLSACLGSTHSRQSNDSNTGPDQALQQVTGYSWRDLNLVNVLRQILLQSDVSASSSTAVHQPSIR